MRLMCIFVHMIDNINAHLKDVAAFSATTADEVEQFRIAYLGKKGHITKLFADFRHVPNEEKKMFGQKINDLRTVAENTLNGVKIKSSKKDTKKVDEDLTKPVGESSLGSHHPLSIIYQLLTLENGVLSLNSCR